MIVPTFNESDNVAELVKLLDQTLVNHAWEVIFVDDNSPDRTYDVVHGLAAGDPRVRVIRRIGRRGLSSACIEGMLATSAPVLAVMDADLQHDERILPEMLQRLRDGDHDIVVGSRYVAGGGFGDWDEKRVAISQFATRLGKFVTKVDLSDPMSGFFMLRRKVLEEVAPDLSGVGFKILLDIFATSTRPLSFDEVPYEFRTRVAGESKLDSAVALDFGIMLLEKTVGRYVPVKFVIFSLVGGLGLFVHLLVLSLVHKGVAVEFAAAQTIATLVAMTFNFFVNNAFTYRDQKLSGWAMLRGWVSFCLACSIGAVANIGIAVYVFDVFSDAVSFLWVWSAVAGVLVGAVWNYAVTAVYTWGRRS